MTSPVRNADLLRRSKVYSWTQVCKYTPRGIQPSDIESVIEINKHFLYFEFKEVGVEMPVGQKLMYERMLDSQKSRACLIVAEHEHLARDIQPIGDVRALTLWMWDAARKAIAKTDRMAIDAAEKFGWWIEQFCLHAEEKPNHFVTVFRRRAGIYPPAKASA